MDQRIYFVVGDVLVNVAIALLVGRCFLTLLREVA